MHEDPKIIAFPSLSEEYLLDLSFGTYQMEQAYSYVMDHLNENGKHIFEMFKEKPNILKVKLNHVILIKLFISLILITPIRI